MRWLPSIRFRTPARETSEGIDGDDDGRLSVCRRSNACWSRTACHGQPNRRVALRPRHGPRSGSTRADSELRESRASPIHDGVGRGGESSLKIVPPCARMVSKRPSPSSSPRFARRDMRRVVSLPHTVDEECGKIGRHRTRSTGGGTNGSRASSSG
jgi:hypothetical protein